MPNVVKPWAAPNSKGLHFWCPACDSVHGIQFEPVRWTWNGDLERPTISPSILSNVGGACPGQPICHSFVRDGQIEFLSDCTHAMAGHTVDLPPWPLSG
jgi:hypothetical protein